MLISHFFLKMMTIKNINCFAKIKHAFYTGLKHDFNKNFYFCTYFYNRS